MLARFGATLQPEIRPAPHPAISDVAELLTARRALVKDRTAALNRGKTLTLPLLKRQRDARRNASFAPVKRVVCCDNEGISCRRTVHAFHQYDNIIGLGHCLICQQCFLSRGSRHAWWARISSIAGKSSKNVSTSFGSTCAPAPEWICAKTLSSDQGSLYGRRDSRASKTSTMLFL